MKKIQLWANFCPKKYYWELQQLPAFTSFTDEWWKHLDVFKEQLILLKKAGIFGLRLNIFNIELTQNAQTIHWQGVENFLSLAEKVGLEIHLCLGPYQYPLWPGIRLPQILLEEKKINKIIDQNKKWKEFGCGFLEEELKRYGRHKNISGFYLGNEWHTDQCIEDFSEKNVIFTVSQKHMETLARLCKKLTRKPIFFNTNFQAHQLKKLEYTFLPLIKVLKNQAWVGFDIYPSRENLVKSPALLLHRKLHSYAHDIEHLKKKFTQRLLVSEYEAQPWGDGTSWSSQIAKSTNLVPKTAQELEHSFPNFISVKSFDQVTLWGAEFWLIAYQLGHTEMLDSVLKLAS